MYENIFYPIDLGGLTLKNRIVFAPTSMGLRGEKLQEKLKAIARGGCAMIVLGDVPVSRRSFRSLHKKRGFNHYRELCDLIHAEGCLVTAQLHQSDSNIKAMLKYIPGVLTKRITMEQLRVLLNEQVERLITELPTSEIERIISDFGQAAVLAKQVGFDMLQVHGDRMCGSFSSTVFNHRTDAYGGSPENRARFAVGAVAAIRAALPDMPIDYKLAVRQENPHYGNAGVLLEELPIFTPLLEQAGVTSWHVALANHGKLTDTIPPKDHPDFSQEGCFLRYCDLVRRHTTLPICGVGGLTDPDFIAAQLAAGRIDCAAMSRQLIADPAWPDKLQSGRAEKIRRCIRCNRDCLGGMQRHEGVHCIYDQAKDAD